MVPTLTESPNDKSVPLLVTTSQRPELGATRLEQSKAEDASNAVTMGMSIKLLGLSWKLPRVIVVLDPAETLSVQHFVLVRLRHMMPHSPSSAVTDNEL